MALSRLAAEFAAEIKLHDWSDAPYRADRAGHRRSDDRNRQVPQLAPVETETVVMNVMWVTAQVLGHRDPNFDVYEYAEACGVKTKNRDGSRNRGILAGIRTEADGSYSTPGKR